jgi:hypothetical protein
MTNRIEYTPSVGWEFSCPLCGYRSRYFHGSKHGAPRLEILAIGDPLARHTSAAIPEALDNVWQPGSDRSEDRGAEIGDDLDLFSFLTPDSQKRLEEILRRLD